MALIGWAKLAWQSDYGQFYLIDRDDAGIPAPEIITEAMLDDSFATGPSGLTVYTQDCLQQHLSIHIYDAEPEQMATEPMSGKPWTRVRDTQAHFPSKIFAVSSPSASTPLPCGPIFLTPATTMNVRISWMEFQGSRDDNVPVEPDVITVELWE